MPSNYNQFIARFKETISRVAEIDGDDDTTLNVIIETLKECGLEDICRNSDAYQSTVGGAVSTDVNDDKKAKKPVVKKSKKDESTVKDNATAAATTTTDATTRPKRVTGYNVFVAERVSDKKVSMKDAAAEWGQMSDEAKAPYNAIAKSKTSKSE